MEEAGDFPTILRLFMARALRRPSDLERLTGLSARTLENWLAGEVRRPREVTDLLKVARALGLDSADATRLLRSASYLALPSLWAQARQAGDTTMLALMAPWAAELGSGDADGPPPPAAHPPYCGLQPFQEADAAYFFGRERLVAELVEHVQVAPLLAVLGPSGSGKSSLVRAGLLPALKAGSAQAAPCWQALLLTPGARPLDTLAVALAQLQGGGLGDAMQLRQALLQDDHGLLLAAELLRRHQPHSHLLIVVDQAEELWTLDQLERLAAQAERQVFLQLLLTAAQAQDSPVRVVWVMRADFLHRTVEYPPLARAITAHDVLVGPLTPEELRRAIVCPAEAAGCQFEAGVVETLVAQTVERMGALPLLAYTLLALWEMRRTDGTLTWTALQELGGVEGGVARRADTVLATHYSAEEQAQVRGLLLRLVQPGEGTADTSRPARLVDIVPSDGTVGEVQGLLQPFVSARLLTMGQDPFCGEAIVEIAHEALIGAWPTLRQWIGEARADLLLQRRLEQAAQEWETNGRSADFLWSGVRLANAEAWAARAQPLLNVRDQAFLDTSRAAAQALAEAERRRAEEREQSNRQLRQRARALAVALGIALLAVGAAVVGFTQARQRTLEAQQQALVSAAQTATIRGNLEQALALALAAIDKQPTAPLDEMTPIIYWAADRGARHRFVGDANAVCSVAFSPDGQTVLSGMRDGTLRVWDVGSGQRLRTLVGHSGAVTAVVFSHDGKMVASGSADRTLRVWDVESGQNLHTLMGHTTAVSTVTFSPDGKTIVSGSRDGTLRIWDVASGQSLRVMGRNGGISTVAFSPDGKMILSGSIDRKVRIWDATSGQSLHTLVGYSTVVDAVAISPDGKMVIFGSRSMNLEAEDIASGQHLYTFGGYGAGVDAVAFSPDGKTVVSGSLDGTLEVWDVATGGSMGILVRHSAAVDAVAFSPDGKTVVSGSLDGTLEVWDVATEGSSRILVGLRNAATAVAFSSDGKTVISGSADYMLRVWDVGTGQSLRTLAGHSAAVTAIVSIPDGKTVVSGSVDGTLRVWDVGTGQSLRTLVGSESYSADVITIASGPDGKTVVSGSVDGTLRVWDIGNGQSLHTLVGPESHRAAVTAVAFSPDGKTLVSGSDDGELVMWDVASGQRLLTLEGYSAAVTAVAFSPDGKTLVSGSADGELVMWNVASGLSIRTLAGHTDAINAVTFSPDGKTLISGSADHLGTLWDVASGLSIRTLAGHTDAVLAVAFSPDGQLAFSASRNGTLRSWPILPLNDLVSWVRANRYVPELTCEQRARYDVEPLC